MGLFFDIDCNAGLEVHGEVVLEDGNLLNQAADQRLVKFGDGVGLLFYEILQLTDLLHLFVLDDAVHLGLPALIPEAKNPGQSFPDLLLSFRNTSVKRVHSEAVDLLSRKRGQRNEKCLKY